MAEVLTARAVRLGGTARTREEAIDEAGGLLIAVDAIEGSYLAAMHERETSISTYMGNGLAIPHGTNEAKSAIRHTAMSFVRYDEPIDWKGQPAEFVVAIAGKGDDHLTVLSRLAEVFTDDAEIARLRAADTPEDVLAVLNNMDGRGG